MKDLSQSGSKKKRKSKTETIQEFFQRAGKITKLPDYENQEPELTAQSKAGSPGVITGPGPITATFQDDGETDTLCLDCPAKSLCSTLCTEAEVYAEEDYVPQREKTIGLTEDYGGWPDILRPRPGLKLTKQETEIVRFILEGKNFTEIRKILEISLHSVHVHASRIHKKAKKHI